MHKMINLGADGNPAPEGAKDWAFVLFPDQNLIFTAVPVNKKGADQLTLEKQYAGLSLLGHSDWRLPTIDELQLVVDRTRCEPALDPAHFREIPNDWLWSSTPSAWASGGAWFVNAGYGVVLTSYRGSPGFALAVRGAGQ